ncbi:hypothetical protein C2E23DRAFT_836323 [Lenzites betulinus]|nr:hypothetical protein C2E23DRAFT_836323 [Lenzites betulinus]
MQILSETLGVLFLPRWHCSLLFIEVVLLTASDELGAPAELTFRRFFDFAQAGGLTHCVKHKIPRRDFTAETWGYLGSRADMQGSS